MLTVGDIYSSSLNGLSFFVIVMFSTYDHLREVKVA
jgi:hypothetical protein